METGCSCGDWLHVEDHCEAIDLVMHKERRRNLLLEETAKKQIWKLPKRFWN